MDHPILGDMNVVREYPQIVKPLDTSSILALDCKKAIETLLHYADHNWTIEAEKELKDFITTVELFQRSQVKPVAALLRKKGE